MTLWSRDQREVSWQIEKSLSLLSQDLWPLNLTRCWHQRRASHTNFLIIREVPLVFLHLCTASYKSIYYFQHIEPLHQSISVSGKGQVYVGNWLYVPAFTTCRRVYSFIICLCLSFLLRVFCRIILEWNPNAKPRFEMVDLNRAKISSTEALFPKIDIFVCMIFTGSSHGTGNVKLFYNGSRFYLKWIFLWYKCYVFYYKMLRFGSASLLYKW